MEILMGLLVFVVGYVIAEFLLGLVPALAKIATPVAVAIGAILAYGFSMTF